MSGDLDLERLADIPDPFAVPDAAHAPAPKPGALGPSPTRAEVRRRRGIAAVGALVYQVAWLLVVEHRGDVGQLPPSTIAIGLLVPAVAAALALFAARVPGRRGLGVPASWVIALAAAAPLLFVLATLATSPPDTESGFWDLAVRCIGVTALLTLGPLLLGVAAFRHAFVAGSRWRTAALGVACGAVAASTMSLACRHSGALHVVVGHGSMMLVAGLAGALLVSRVTRA